MDSRTQELNAVPRVHADSRGADTRIHAGIGADESGTHARLHDHTTLIITVAAVTASITGYDRGGWQRWTDDEEIAKTTGKRSSSKSEAEFITWTG